MSLIRQLRKVSVLAGLFLAVTVSIPRPALLDAGSSTEEMARQAEALLELSQDQNLGQHVLALQSAQQALTLFQELGNDSGMARAYGQIGRCYFAQNALQEATQNYEKALQLWRVLNNRREQAKSLIQLGAIDGRRSEWSSAISFYADALQLIDGENEPLLIVQIAVGMAYIFNESGLPEQALSQLDRALDYCGRTEFRYDDPMTLQEMAVTYYILGNYDEARTRLHQALALVEPDSLYAASFRLYLGKVYSSIGEFAIARQHLESALATFTRTKNPMEAGQALMLIGQTYEQQGNAPAARQKYRDALKIFKTTADRINQAAIYHALGCLELKTVNYDTAEDYLWQSIEATENIRRIPKATDLAAGFSATVYDRYQSYVECLMRKHKAKPGQGFDVRAFEVSELSRGRSLSELLRAIETDLLPGVDPKLAAREKSLRQMLRAKEDHRVTLLSGKYSKEEIDALQSDLARLEEEYKQVTETIRAQYPGYDQIIRPAAWSLAQIREHVITDDQTVLLEYSLGKERSYAWAVTRDGIRSYTLLSAEVINGAAQKVYKLLSTRPGSEREQEVAAAISELSRLVLAPLAPELNKNRIIVVADGALHYIPFQVLTPLAGGEPVVADREPINAVSASILGEVRKQKTQHRPPKLLAAFGAPVFKQDKAAAEQSSASGTFEMARLGQALRDIEITGDSRDLSAIQRLFYAARELANLREVAPGAETLIAAEATATRERLLKTDLTQFAILHFATHGVLDPKRPECSGLVLSTVDQNGQSQNGFVSLQDIYGLRAPVDLVVLSACRTALGKDVRGEGLLGLTRGFMYAGASSVVASLWKVDDEASAELMKCFYSSLLKDGMTPAAALRAAQNTIRQRPEWSAPFYWAGFTLQGEYLQVIKPTPLSASINTGLYWKTAVAGTFILSAGIVWWFLRRRYRNRKRASNYSTSNK